MYQIDKNKRDPQLAALPSKQWPLGTEQERAASDTQPT